MWGQCGEVFENKISNNQRLESAGDNDRRSKHFCSIAMLFVSFWWQIVKARVIKIAFCAFHSFLRGSQWGGGFYGYRLKFWLFYGYRLKVNN